MSYTVPPHPLPDPATSDFDPDPRRRIDRLNAEAWQLRRSDPQKALALAGEAIRLSEASDHSAGTAYALVTRSTVKVWLGDVNGAVEDAGDAILRFEELGDPRGRAVAQIAVANALIQQGDVPRALEHAYESRLVLAQAGEREHEARVLNMTAVGLMHLGDWAAALEHVLEGVRISDGLDGADMVRADLLANAGVVYAEIGEPRRALESFLEALVIQASVGAHTVVPALLSNIGKAHEDLGEYTGAGEYYQRALILARERGLLQIEVMCLINLASLAARRGKANEASRSYLQALRLARQAGLKYWETSALIEMAAPLQALGLLGRASIVLRHAIRLATDIGASALMYEAHQALSAVAERRGNVALALEQYKAFHAAREVVFNAQADQKIRALMIRAESERALREAELLQLKNQEIEAARSRLEQALAEKATLVAELERQTREDSLTGVSNRRHLDERLGMEVERARRLGHDLSVAMVDVDHFKRINDKFSHQVGDAVLTRLAGLLRAQVRGIDVVARYGGEEFAIVLIETRLEDAAQTGERLRLAVESYDWQRVHPGLAVTVSVGVASYSAPEPPEELLVRADARLYTAKRSGRNQLCC